MCIHIDISLKKPFARTLKTTFIQLKALKPIPEFLSLRCMQNFLAPIRLEMLLDKIHSSFFRSKHVNLSLDFSQRERLRLLLADTARNSPGMPLDL